jgi:hypothetical protein
MKAGHLIVDRVIQSGRIDATAETHIVEAFRRFDRDGTDGVGLLRYLGIPTTASKRRQATRDYWLAAAADLVGGDTVTVRARLLSDALARFERKWSRMRDLSSPPSDLSDLEGCLFFSMKAGRPPGPKQLQNIIAEAFSPGSFQRGGAF